MTDKLKTLEELYRVGRDDLEIDKKGLLIFPESVSMSSLRQAARQWERHLLLRLKNTVSPSCSREAYAATDGVINLKRIDNEVIKLLRADLLGQIYFIRRFFNLDADGEERDK